MIKYLHKELKSFRFAFNGIRFLSRDHNFYFHFPVGLVALGFAAFFQVSTSEWLWVVAAIFAVWVTETINTAIEKLVDLVTREHNELAGQVKDISAAAVLLAVLFAGTIGLVVFLPYVIDWFGGN